MALDLPLPDEPAYGNSVRSTLHKLDRSIHRDSVGNTEIASTTGVVKVTGSLSATGGMTVTGDMTGVTNVTASATVQGATVTATGQLNGDRITVNGGSPAAGQLKGSTVLASGAVTAGSVNAGSGTIMTTGAVQAATLDASGNVTLASASQVVFNGDSVMKRGATDRIDFDALVRFNDGSGLQIGSDTNLYRVAANELKTDDALSVGGNFGTSGTATIDGNLQHAGNGVGFYGKTPVTRRTMNIANYSGGATQSQINRAVQDLLFILDENGLIVDNTGI